MPITLYGIPNCQTVKKARNWLDKHQIHYQFMDFKKTGVTQELIRSWLTHHDVTQLINRSGMTFRNLSDGDKKKSLIIDEAIQLMMANPSMIKRPVLDDSKNIHLGFKEDLYQTIFMTS
jgi:Spx/MgsR family transcriptional regulator